MVSLRDFHIGIIDFFAVLLPGAAAIHLLGRTGWVKAYVPEAVEEITWWVGFVFGAYLAGHLIFMIGAWLDPLYDRWRRRRKVSAQDKAYLAATRLRDTLSPALVGSSFTTLKWSKSYLALRAPAARLEIDALEATSKFFRSLVVLFLLAAILSLVLAGGGSDPAHRIPPASLCAVLAWLSFLRFCDQRWKGTELAYAYAVLVAAPATGVPMPSVGAELDPAASE